MYWCNVLYFLFRLNFASNSFSHCINNQVDYNNIVIVYDPEFDNFMPQLRH